MTISSVEHSNLMSQIEDQMIFEIRREITFINYSQENIEISLTCASHNY